MQTDIQRHLAGVYSVLRSRINLINRSIGHAGEQGAANEQEIRRLLLDFLPTRYGIGSGIIIGTDGRASKQQDIIIYDNNRADYTLSRDSKIFLADHVLATIEVKTTYSRKALREALMNVASVKSLKIVDQPWTGDESNILTGALEFRDNRPSPPVCIVFFFSSASTRRSVSGKRLVTGWESALAEVDIENQPDLVFSLSDAAFFEHNDICDHRPDTQSFFFVLRDTSNEPTRKVSVDGTDSKTCLEVDFPDNEIIEPVVQSGQTIRNQTGSSSVVVLFGDAIDRDLSVYPVLNVGRRRYLLDNARAFIVFINTVERLLQRKKASTVWLASHYFGEHMFRRTVYPADFGPDTSSDTARVPQDDV